MYDSMNGGLVTSSEIVLGGISCRFGSSSSLRDVAQLLVHRVGEVGIRHRRHEMLGRPAATRIERKMHLRGHAAWGTRPAASQPSTACRRRWRGRSACATARVP